MSRFDVKFYNVQGPREIFIVERSLFQKLLSTEGPIVNVFATFSFNSEGTSLIICAGTAPSTESFAKYTLP